MSTDEPTGGDATRSWAPLPPERGPGPAAEPPPQEPPARQWSVPAPVPPPTYGPQAYPQPPTYGPQAYAQPQPYGPQSGDGSPPPYGPPPSFGAPPPPGYGGPPSGGSSGGVWIAFGLATVAALAAIAFLIVAVVVTRGDDGDDDLAARPAGDAAEQPTTTLPGGRLAPEPPIPTTDGPHEFFFTEPDGDPVAWDPCDPIHYVVNDARAPEGAMQILEEAIVKVEEATGLVFVDQGATDETAPLGDDVRPDSDPARYGDGWSPVLISWTDAMADPNLDGAAGLALPSYREAASGEQVYVTGYVEMAGDYAADLIERDRRDDVLGVMMHELGHLVGLGHVEPSNEVMTDDPNSTPSEWGPGDRVGLAAVGRGECEPDL